MHYSWKKHRGEWVCCLHLTGVKIIGFGRGTTPDEAAENAEIDAADRERFGHLRRI